MKLIYIHQHFATNDGTAGTRSYDVSRHLASMGHRVTMVCGRAWNSGLAPVPPWRMTRTEEIDGIRVVVCNVEYNNSMRVPARMWAFGKFAALATVAAMRERGVDLVFATSTPLTVGIPGRVSSTLKRCAYVFEVRDLWPEDLLAAGRLRPGLQYRAWEWLEAFSYASSRKILLVSRGFHDRMLERGFDPERLATVELGADSGLFREVEPDTAYLEQHGLAGKTVAVYAGAYGDANGLSQVVDAAAHLRDRDDIAVLIIGDGKMRPTLVRQVQEQGLTNVHLLPWVPKLQLPGILAGCHLGLMILKQITRPRWVTPNKLFDYMFAGLPILVNFGGTAAELVQAEGVGVACEPGSAEDLARWIRHYADHPEEREAVGRRAREVGFGRYDRRRIAERLAGLFEQSLAGGSREPTR